MAPYPAAIFLAVSSMSIILLIIPPMWWHLRSRNVGASAVIAWIITMNLIIVINALIWPNDDFDGLYKGEGLCDIEVKIQVASQVAFPAAFACVLRALAAVMNAERVTMGSTRAERMRNTLIDLLWCFGFPCLQMFFHYIVQARRYYIWGISGCLPAVSNSWVTVLLILVPPVIWTLICGYYAILIVIRLHHYRRSFQMMLANNNTNKSRFLRLFLLCVLWVFANVPIQFYTFYQNLSVPHVPYSWTEVHNPEEWREIEMVASNGGVVYDRYIWLSAGVAMFVFFGFGREALNMYSAGIKAMGLGRIIPQSVKDGMHKSSGAFSDMVSDIGSKAKTFWTRKSDTASSTWSGSVELKDTSTVDTDLSRKTQPSTISSLKDLEMGSGSPATTPRATTTTSYWSRLVSLLKPAKCVPEVGDNVIPIACLSGQEATVTADIYSSVPSPALLYDRRVVQGKMLVRKEISQASKVDTVL